VEKRFPGAYDVADAANAATLAAALVGKGADVGLILI